MEQDTYSVRVKPERTAKSLLEDLIKENSKQFNINQFRTIQKRIAKWRKKQIKIHQEKNYKNILSKNNAINNYISLIAHFVING
jgi:predicted flavoprotein YhiN